MALTSVEEVVRAELDLDGRVVTSRGDAVALWPAIVSGHLSLMERAAGNHRRYPVVENPVAARTMRALTSSELAVVAHAARGLPTKLIAYTLGLSPAAISTRLASAAAKVGAVSRIDLVRLAALFARDARPPGHDIRLTDAERDVLALLQRGLSNQAIAWSRSRSVRTVANQVASLLRKTKCGSRRELVVASRAR